MKKILIFSHNYDEICKKYLHSPLIIELTIIKLIFEIPIQQKLSNGKIRVHLA